MFVNFVCMIFFSEYKIEIPILETFEDHHCMNTYSCQHISSTHKFRIRSIFETLNKLDSHCFFLKH